MVLFNNIKFATAIDPDVSYIETWESWVVAMQAYVALFEVSVEPSDALLDIRLYRKNRAVKAVGKSSDANVERWIDAFCLAVICRDERKLNYLCNIPLEKTLREYGESKGTEYAPYVYHWVAALQALVTHREGFEDELAAALEKSDPEISGIGDEESVGKLVFPEMLILLRLVERDSGKFNEALAAGVAAFGEYWTANEDRANDMQGVFPLMLVAFACMAYDIAQVDPDFELDVASGYLPKHLVQHSWFNEFPI